MTALPTRVPAGVPSGGQFATTERPEVDTPINAPRPTHGDAERWTDDFFASDDGEPYVNACMGSRTAGGMCSEVSETFASWLRLQGEPGVTVMDCNASGHEYIPDGSYHTVVNVRGLVIDLTHRQFDDGADLPHVQPIEDFEAEWDIYDEG